jgi:hypothetical protein
VRALRDTELSYRIYWPSRTQNYFPERVILENKINIKAISGFKWIKLPAFFPAENRFVLVEADANPDVELGISSERLTGVTSFVKSINRSHNLYDIDSLERREFHWNKCDYSICFRIENDADVYCGENINNGYARPYGQPNLWISNNRVEDEYVIVSLNEKKTIKEIILRFDPDLNRRLLTSSANYDFNVISAIVKDYDVYYHNGTDFELLKEVRGNYCHANWLKFSLVYTDKVKIKFKATNGCSCAGVYEIRIY